MKHFNSKPTLLRRTATATLAVLTLSLIPAYEVAAAARLDGTGTLQTRSQPAQKKEGAKAETHKVGDSVRVAKKDGDRVIVRYYVTIPDGKTDKQVVPKIIDAKGKEVKLRYFIYSKGKHREIFPKNPANIYRKGSVPQKKGKKGLSYEIVLRDAPKAPQTPSTPQAAKAPKAPKALVPAQSVAGMPNAPAVVAAPSLKSKPATAGAPCPLPARSPSGQSIVTTQSGAVTATGQNMQVRGKVVTLKPAQVTTSGTATIQPAVSGQNVVFKAIGMEGKVVSTSATVSGQNSIYRPAQLSGTQFKPSKAYVVYDYTPGKFRTTKSLKGTTYKVTYDKPRKASKPVKKPAATNNHHGATDPTYSGN